MNPNTGRFRPNSYAAHGESAAMSTIPFSQGMVDLIVLFLVMLPLGSVLLQLGEWLAGRQLPLLVTERILLSFFASGGLLFLCASIPLPVYGLPLVVGLLGFGAAVFAVLAWRDRARSLRSTFAALRSWPLLAVALGSLGLLALEVSSGSLLLPNGVDGAVHSLFVNLILRNHTIPTDLQPFSSDGVIYPLGAPVWMTLPVVLFGWPIVSSPILLPALFASLSVVAGFSLGSRLFGESHSGIPWMGLLFAAFFGGLASWPRLYVGGSYDFIFALPLFVGTLGLLRGWVLEGSPSWRTTGTLGIFLGCVTALSAAVGVALVLLLGAWILAFQRSAARALGPKMVHLLMAVGVAALFVIRSIAGVVVWYNYPGHVLTPVGAAPYRPLINSSFYNGWVGQLDPFVPYKAKISPIPLLSVELEILLAVGIALSLWLLVRPRSMLSQYLSADVVRWVLVSTVTLFAETAALLALGSWNGSASGIQSVTNLWETSILLFFFYQLFALLPLVISVNLLRQRPQRPHDATVLPLPPRSLSPHPSFSQKPIGRTVAVIVLLVALGTGGGATIGAVPGYLHSYLLTQANGTAADVAALEWTSAHLPGCSRVLVAPGSAAQFLPEYTVATVIFPAFPTPANLSYTTLYLNLSAGIYSNTTRADLVELGVTEVFATGQTTNTFLPFIVALLERSSDFALLFAQGDATILSFLPGVMSSGCAPTA